MIPRWLEYDPRETLNYSVVAMLGISSSSTLNGVVFDERVALGQKNPEYEIVFFPLKETDQLSLEDVRFYANFLSYINETITFISPTREQFEQAKFSFLNPEVGEVPHDDYVYDAFTHTLYLSYEACFDLKYGPLTTIESVFGINYSTDRFEDLKHVFPSKEYGNVRKELYLYATAMQQLTFSSEYLNYYRIIEAVSNSNGVAWINENINRINSHKFPPVMIRTHKRSQISVFDLIIARVKKTIDGFVSSPQSFGQYMYSIRNDLAHAKRPLEEYTDAGIDFGSVYEWLFVAKLLARIGIDSKKKTVGATEP